MPPAKYLQSLKTHLSNLSDNDHLSLQSIHNPTDRKERLPHWVLTIWDAISSLISSRNRWTRSYLWVNRFQDYHQEGEGKPLALEYFKVLGWGSKMSLYGLRGVTNLSLTQFLSDNCINGDAIDLMARQLASRRTLPEGVLIFDLRLSNFLSRIGSQVDLERPSPVHVQDFEHQLTKAQTLYFPLFYQGRNHWIVFKVDLCSKKVAYGTFSCRLSISL